MEERAFFFGLKRPFIAVAPVLAVFCPETDTLP
jgi:hypothetical protein